jgi:hypothetical protein
MVRHGARCDRYTSLLHVRHIQQFIPDEPLISVRTIALINFVALSLNWMMQVNVADVRHHDTSEDG